MFNGFDKSWHDWQKIHLNFRVRARGQFMSPHTTINHHRHQQQFITSPPPPPPSSPTLSSPSSLLTSSLSPTLSPTSSSSPPPPPTAINQERKMPIHEKFRRNIENPAKSIRDCSSSSSESADLHGGKIGTFMTPPPPNRKKQKQKTKQLCWLTAHEGWEQNKQSPCQSLLQHPRSVWVENGCKEGKCFHRILFSLKRQVKLKPSKKGKPNTTHLP